MANIDVPDKDISLATEISSQEIVQLLKLCKTNNIWISIGIFELYQLALYDSVVTLSPEGKVAFTQRRNSEGWHSPSADTSFYKCDDQIYTFNSCIGKILFVICGDLFDDEIIQKAKTCRADWVIFPFARCFDSEEYDQERWDKKELPEYVNRLCQIAPNSLMINYLSSKELGGYFGGAWVVNNGNISLEIPLGTSDILLFDTQNCSSDKML